MLLSIQQKAFPNATLTNNFYIDQTEINALIFMRCDFKIIAANAFNRKSLLNLRYLQLMNFELIDFQFGAFNGLNNFDELRLYKTTIKNLRYNIFEPIALSLRSITLAESSMNLYNIIAAIEYPKLREINLYQINFNRIITVNSVAKCPAIFEIFIISSGIEAVQLGAFDHLADTLRLICLRENKLKTLPSNIFDKLERLIVMSSEGNPWECDCSLSKLTKKYGNVFGVVCEDDRWEGDSQIDCAEQNAPSELSPIEAKKCWRHYGTNAMRVNFFTNYRIRTTPDGTKLVLKNSKRTAFRILIMAAQMTNVHCVRIAAKYASIALDKYRLPFGVRSIAIIDPINSKAAVSPMHFVTFNVERGDVWLNQNAKYATISLILTAYAIAFVSAAYLSIYLVPRHLFLLQRLESVLLTRDSTTNKIDAALIMPKTWICSVRARESSKNVDDGRRKHSENCEEMNKNIATKSNEYDYINTLNIISAINFGYEDVISSPESELSNE